MCNKIKQSSLSVLDTRLIHLKANTHYPQPNLKHLVPDTRRGRDSRRKWTGPREVRRKRVWEKKRWCRKLYREKERKTEREREREREVIEKDREGGERQV